ncbi:MAG: hypothetical protein CVT64_09580 [Actinobacteria bacterium HGW-Actinobacteria-4]|nr:MAG: hypothetical protein CVT64_09580 [Actinobacteria bacterium HGW-Actinobacteria-4]
MRWVDALAGLTNERRVPVDLPEYHVRPEVPHTPVRVFIGPANFAGQANAWARALEQHVPGVSGTVFSLETVGGFDFPHDFGIPPYAYRRNRRWQREQFGYVRDNFTHVIIESGRPLFADLMHLDPFREAKALTRNGLVVGMISHGSDTRLPSRHAARFTWSPYRDKDWAEVPRLERQARHNLAELKHFHGPVFASTPDLLDDLPFARWCPVTVDLSTWASTRPLLKGKRPVVVHAPSNGHVKGSEYADAALEPHHDSGLVEYRRIERVLSEQMPKIYRSADIVLDQFRIGSYGVAACEAMAAGRVVVGNVTGDVRRAILDATGMELPIVQAEPHEIGDVVAELVENPARMRAIGRASLKYVTEVHDGRYAARVISTGLEFGKKGP